MVKFISLLLLAGYTIGGVVAQTGPRPSIAKSGGCACPCYTRPVKVVIWKPEDGAIDQFVGRTVKAQYHRGEPLILLGRSPRGDWSLETSLDEDIGQVLDINLVCTTLHGKREAFHLIQNYPTASALDPHAGGTRLSSPVLRTLQSLESPG